MASKLDPATLRWAARRALAMAAKRSWSSGIEGGGRLYLRDLAAVLRAKAKKVAGAQ